MVLFFEIPGCLGVGGGDCGCLPESVAQLPRLLFDVCFYLVVFAVTAQCILEGATARKMFLLVSAFGVCTLVSSSALVQADRTLDFCSLIRKEFGEGFHGTVLVVDPSCGKCETELMAAGWHIGSHEFNAVIFNQSSVESLTAMSPLLAPTVLRMQVDLGSHLRQKVPFRVRCAKGVS